MLRSRRGIRSGVSSDRGSAQTMSSSSSSVRPTSGPRSSAPSASVSRRSARTRVSAIRSWISWRRKRPLPAWVATGMPRRSKRFLIAPQIAAGRRQQGDVARLAGARVRRLRRSMIASLPISRAHISATASASASRCCSARGLAVFVGHGDVEGGDAQALVAIGMERVERGEARLTVGRQQRPRSAR